MDVWRCTRGIVHGRLYCVPRWLYLCVLAWSEMCHKVSTNSTFQMFVRRMDIRHSF